METGNKLMYSIWMVADLIRDTFPRGRYYYIILPFTFLRRLDCVLESTKEKVLEANRLYSSSVDDLDKLLCEASGNAFYNISPYTTFSHLLEEHDHFANNLRSYIDGFSDNIHEVLDKFDFNATIGQLDEVDLLYSVIKGFNEIDLHLEKVPNHIMGSIFEDLVRILNEVVYEDAGYYAPREVIQLMVAITLSKDLNFSKPYSLRKIYDPCCGAGSMLTTAKEGLLKINPNAQVYLYGQEIHRETFAICKADLYNGPSFLDR